MQKTSVDLMLFPLKITKTTYTINRSLGESIFPSGRKTAIVTAVYKTGDGQEVSNYSPITILHAISSKSSWLIQIKEGYGNSVS